MTINRNHLWVALDIIICNLRGPNLNFKRSRVREIKVKTKPEYFVPVKVYIQNIPVEV